MGRQEKKRIARRRQAERRVRDARRLSDQQLLGALASMGGDPLSVVHAWASSPMGVHRHLSLSTAVQAAVRAAATNRSPGGPDVEAAAAWDLVVGEAAGLAVLEDAQPWDPRLPAIGRFGGRLYRLYPGMLERPVAALRTAELIAITIDPTLVPRLRFGLGDLMSVCLTHMERAVGLLAPAWPEGDLPEIGAPPSVTPDEISAANGVVEWLGLDSPLLHVGRAAAALEWATVKPEYLRADLAQDMTGTCFGTAMAVAAPGGRLLALPLPYIAEGWQHAIAVLAEAADRDDATAAGRWLRAARAETARLLDRVRDMPDPVLVSSVHGPVAVLPFGRRHLLAVAVAASLSPGCDAEPATRAVGAIRPGSRLRCQPGFLDVPSDAEVVKLVVVATAGTSAVRAPVGMAVLTLEDLARISDTAGRADELFAFCRDLGDPPGGVELFGWEKADTWEWWQAEQAIHVMGRAPDAMYVAAHQVGKAEWEQAAKQANIEQALQRVGMPPASALRELEVDGDKMIALTDDMEIWHLTMLGEAVIAATSPGTEPDEFRSLSADLPGTLCWALIHLKTSAAEMMRALGVDAVTVQFSFTDDAESPLEFAGITDDGRISLTWTPQLPETEISSPGWTQRRLGETLTEGLRRLAGAAGSHGREAVDRLGAQWETVPPVFALTQEPAPQRAQHPRGHRPSPPWARSQARQHMAERLRDTGESPRIMRGTEAMTFETRTVAPWLMDQARAALSGFSATAMLSRAGAELEAVTASRQQARRERQRHAHVWKSPGAVERADRTDSELAGQRAVLAALLEITLAEPPSGTKTPDAIEWATLLGLADLYVQATIRSDGLRWNIDGEATAITDHYEVIRSPGGTPLLDVAAFNAARIRATRAAAGDPLVRAPVPIVPAAEELNAMEQPGDVPAQGQLADIDPALADVDRAMRDDLGCSAHTLLAVCIHVSRWLVTDAHPTATVEREELINDITAEVGISADEASAAVEALTLRGEALASEGVQPWKGRARDHRLITRPLVGLADGTIMLLPWNTDLAGQVLLQYLFHGLLPWAQPRLDSLPRVKTALDQLRIRRTRVLEDETHQRLEALGFLVRSRVKPQHAHVLGMPSLPGELDHVAAHPDGETIWVIDDKALAEVFTPAEIARGVNSFHDPDGEIDKLRAKVTAVAAHTSSVSTSLGLPEGRRTVKGLFVTNHPVPAAFATDQPIKFTVLSDLADVLELPRAST